MTEGEKKLVIMLEIRVDRIPTVHEINEIENAFSDHELSTGLKLLRTLVTGNNFQRKSPDVKS